MKLVGHRFTTPVGDVVVALDGSGALTRLDFEEPHGGLPPDLALAEEAGELVWSRRAAREVERQLRAYLRGRLREFDLPLAPAGTAFQRRVWKAVAAIPYGRTRTYAQVARTVQRPTAVRAVGRANATNRIAIVIPCHRLVGANGALTGYAAGIAVKRRLLDLESSARSVGA